MLPSATLRWSSSGSRSRFLDRELVLAELRRACRRACSKVPEIHSVLLFGSLARQNAGPRSDADLLVILKHSPHRRRMDRIPYLLEAFSPSPFPLDIVPWTVSELESALAEGDPWLLRIREEGISLL